MKLSKTRLLDEAAASGFRPDTLEKVIHLLELLSLISENEYLRERLVLKGGTALNLFVFDVSRRNGEKKLEVLLYFDRLYTKYRF